MHESLAMTAVEAAYLHLTNELVTFGTFLGGIVLIYSNDNVAE